VIVTQLDGSLLFYRAHAPEWASQPLSGAGAAKHGGRLNRPGVHALYLAGSSETAITEYQRLASIMPPCTLVAYHVALASVVDFRGGFVPAIWSLLWQELYCNWRRMALLEKVEPPSWVLADEVIAAGHAGVMFPSAHTGGVNLVVYPDALRPDDQLAVHDPEKKLPRDRSSWR
jgi:RES domain-containing protein